MLVVKYPTVFWRLFTIIVVVHLRGYCYAEYEFMNTDTEK